MSAPDYRNDLAAFFKAVYGDEAAKMAYQSNILEALTRKRKDPKDEVFQWSGVDYGKPGGDQTAYTRYSYDGHKIVIEDIDLFDVYETADSDRLYRGRRPSIADLVARIGQKRCGCDGGLEHLGNFETGLPFTQVCTRCDGFSTRRWRGFRARR